MRKAKNIRGEQLSSLNCLNFGRAMPLPAVLLISTLAGGVASCTNCSNNAISKESRAVKVKGVPRPNSPHALPYTINSASSNSDKYHSVFSLPDNRLLSHMVQDGGLFIPVGHPGFAKYITFMRPWNPWRINAKEEGRHVALAARSVTWLRFPLTEDQAQQAKVLNLSLKSQQSQVVGAKLNNTKLKPAKLNPGWQTVSIEIPGGALQAGENKIELSWGATGRFGDQKASAAVEWIQLGPKPLANVALTTPAQGSKLVLPQQGGVAYYLHPYRGTKLRVRLADSSANACQLKVRLIIPGSQPKEISPSQNNQSSNNENEILIDLNPVANRVVRLELLADGASCKQLALNDASLVMPGPAPKLKRTKPPKNVFFWMMDNARGDRYSFYNPSTRVKTPIIDEIGKSGTVFTQAFIQGTESRVSHASIWTSLYPKQHNFIAPKARLDLNLITLPKALRKAGLYTTAWIANGFVSKFWGFGEGWNFFRNNLHQGGGLTAEALVNQATEFLQKHNGKPFYLYLGTIDSHVSWRGRQPWLNEYHPEPYSGVFEKNVLGKLVEKMAAGSKSTSPADRKRIIAIYDSTVSYNDHQLGRLVQILKDKGIFDETMIIITADHGEELWDFGKIGHGCSLKQALVAVPLIIHYPPLFGRGVKVKQGVDILSILPTVLDALGAPIPENIQGESLMPLAQGIGTSYPRPSIASQYELAHVIRLERWKLWVGGQGEPRLFDLESKSAEHKEVSASHPLEARWLTDTLSTFLVYQDRWRAARWGVASNHTAALADDLESGKGPAPIQTKK